MKRLFFLLILTVILSCYADDELTTAISLGPVVIGEDRLKINTDHFEIKSTLQNIGFEGRIVPNSIQWIRHNKTLLLPRALLHLKFNLPSSEVTLRYSNKPFIMQDDGQQASTQLYFSLFNPSPIDVYLRGVLVGQVTILPKENVIGKSETHMLDYSCARFDVEVQGLDGDFLSVGCHLIPKSNSSMDKETLEVQFVAPRYRLMDSSAPPYYLNLIGDKAVKIALVNEKNEKKEIMIKANVPKHIHSLNTAIGFGPYVYDSYDGSAVTKPTVTSPIMLYANYRISEGTSIRAFDALFKNQSTFNNLGGYFAYNIGSAIDNRINLMALVGMQLITFQQGHGKTYNKAIYPQGFELTYSHAFGFKNYNLGFGMFITPKASDNYDNVWLRFGKGWFWELNYLSWKEDSHFARGWGLSVGLPFLKFL